MLRAGDLRYRITIKNRTIVKNSIGESKEVFTTIAENLPCAVKPISGREKFRESSDREVSGQTNRFIIRYREDVTPTSQIFYNDKTWDVLYIAEMGVREGLEITAEVLK